jgi:sulfur carrier protein ThiS
MSATIRPLGMLKTYIGDLKETSVEAGMTVRETIQDIGINPELVAGVFVNGEQQPKDYVVQDGDVIKLLAVIGGG